jgi:hypothetical protein
MRLSCRGGEITNQHNWAGLIRRHDKLKHIGH